MTRRLLTLLAALGIGSLFNIGCDRQRPVVTVGAPLPTCAKVGKAQVVMGDVAPPPTTTPRRDSNGDPGLH